MVKGVPINEGEFVINISGFSYGTMYKQGFRVGKRYKVKVKSRAAYQERH